MVRRRGPCPVCIRYVLYVSYTFLEGRGCKGDLLDCYFGCLVATLVWLVFQVHVMVDCRKMVMVMVIHNGN